MVSKKKIVVAVITAAALSIGVAGTASAHGNGAKGNSLSGILSDLVKKGTLTQAQVDAINAAKTTAESAMQASRSRSAARCVCAASPRRCSGIHARAFATAVRRRPANQLCFANSLCQFL